MSGPAVTSRKYWNTGIALAVAGLLVAFPPFHVRPIAQARAGTEATKFDPASGAAVFWAAHIERAAESAHDVATVAARLANGDAADLGRRSSVGGQPFFVVKGSGTVSSVESRAVFLKVEGTNAEIQLRTGPLFGNVLRDGFESTEVAALSSFDANALSAELNKIAESRVQPTVVELAKPGQKISFVGATQRREAPDGHVSLVIIPVSVEAAK
jgi:hypothetical protein